MSDHPALRTCKLTMSGRRTTTLAGCPPQHVPSPSAAYQSCSPQALLSISSDEDVEIEYVGMLPSSLSPKPLPTPSPALQSQPSIITDDALDPKEVAKRETCKQHLVSVLSGQSAIGAYPFMLHIEEHIPWEFSSHRGALLLHARNCEDRHLDKDGLCRPCQSLLSNDRFKKVLARMQEGVHEYTPYKYHGLASLAAIARKKERTIELYRTRRINDMRKLLGCEGVITLHRQILLAMSTGTIPRVDRILRVASDRRMSVAAILEMVRKAGQGIY